MNGSGMVHSGSPWPIFSASGTWLAFVTSDNLVWRPDIQLIGHIVHQDIFATNGAYLRTIDGNVLIWLHERAVVSNPRLDVPIEVPGYPGLPQPSLLRAVGPGQFIEWQANDYL